jgi:putative endonuclease
MTKYAAGLLGQQAAEAHLMQKGLRILARNYRIKTGEIDLIAADGTYLVFIEVKTRASDGYGDGREAVTLNKQRRIIKTAMYYVVRYGLAERDIRFDVVEVTVREGVYFVEHIADAFGA